jgi:hypothetical protein
MDGHTNPTGWELSADEVIAWVDALVDAAAARGMGVIHKNASDLVDDLEPNMAALLLESCVQDRFCEEAAAPFLDRGKPVLDAEYPERWQEAGQPFVLADVCAEAEAAGVSTLIKTLDLNAQSIVCAAR